MDGDVSVSEVSVSQNQALARFGQKMINFNSDCMRLLPEACYLKLGHSAKSGLLLAMKASRAEYGSIPWVTEDQKGDIKPKRIWWPGLIKLINKNLPGSDQKGYSVRANLWETEGQRVIVFDLSNQQCSADLEPTIPSATKYESTKLDPSVIKSADFDLTELGDDLSLTFRLAQPGDEVLVFEFIRRLADFEKKLHLVTINLKMLSDWLFKRSAIEVLFLLKESQEIGFALFYPNFSTFQGQAGLYIEDLFVLPDYRRSGAGTALLSELSALAVERGFSRLDWQCLHWNTQGQDFYHSLGAEPIDEWKNYRLSGPNLRTLAGLD
jgi:GNAT superfamily N-acetyltransferase